ncbi:hypothetical protein [Micromonospora fluostatini]|uniref:hypothetical protein n=1 Tax=Micromonospora sp. JCM 30529 TaxID=3421643 RepID=UPI003D178B19
MRAITAATAPLADDVELVPIRFPNDDRPLAGCDAGTLIYVFANDDTAVCPYLVFAARTPQSRHADREILVGNILDAEVTDALGRYQLHDVRLEQLVRQGLPGRRRRRRRADRRAGHRAAHPRPPGCR